MATSFGALCTDFYINQQVALKMDLPGDRETILHLFDRIRAELSDMDRFHRYSDELALESRRREGEYRWLALRQQSIRSGHVNGDSLEQMYRVHRLVLELAPFYLTISPLDVNYVELLFGFDLDCKANHNEIVYDALIAETSLAGMLDYPDARPTDVQPIFGFCLPGKEDVQVFFEVKTRTSPAQVRRGRYRAEPISVFLTLRRQGPIQKPDELPAIFEMLRGHAERLAADKVAPQLLTPISRAIMNTP